MGAIQDHISIAGFDGTVDQSWTRFINLHEGANPWDLVPLYEHTGLYAEVDTRVDWTAIVFPREPWLPFPRPTLADALALHPAPSCDVTLFINDAFLAGSAIPAGWLGRLQLDYPNHYVALASPLTLVDGYVGGRVWTWGGFQDLHVAEGQFLRNYFGAVVCRS
jgi:hypothetical protein